MILRRLAGILFIITAAAGFFLSAAGIFQVWRSKPLAIRSLGDNLMLLAQALDATDAALDTAQGTINTLKLDAASLQTTTKALAKAIHDSEPTLTSLSDLLNLDFPETITATQTALGSAASSAKLIDDILAALTSLPFSPLKPYKPEVPLSTALTDVSDSLNALPTSLTLIDQSITGSKADLTVVEEEFATLSESIPAVIEDLDKALSVITQYQVVVSKLQERVSSLQKTTPRWIITAAWVLTIMLVWFLVAQLAMLLQGLELVNKKPIAG